MQVVKGKSQRPGIVRPEALTSCTAVKYLIKAQLSEDITEDDFDIGYLHGNTVISIRNKADLDDIWECLRKGSNTTLWCDGMILVVKRVVSVHRLMMKRLRRLRTRGRRRIRVMIQRKKSRRNNTNAAE